MTGSFLLAYTQHFAVLLFPNHYYLKPTLVLHYRSEKTVSGASVRYSISPFTIYLGGQIREQSEYN